MLAPDHIEGWIAGALIMSFMMALSAIAGPRDGR